MALTADTETKPSVPPSSRSLAASPGGLENLLTNAELGVSITGVILLAEEPKQFSGTSAKGKPYNFAQRRLQLWTGNKTTLCTQRKDKIEEFGAVPVGVKVTLRVLSGRIDQGQMVFDVEN